MFGDHQFIRPDNDLNVYRLILGDLSSSISDDSWYINFHVKTTG